MNVKNVAMLDPPELWHEFAQISDIPRGSRNEAAIIAHIKRQAIALSLEHRQDAAGNLLIRLPASTDMADRPGIIIQGHVDMVCEKDSDVIHDFEHDPLRLVVDGDWLRADHTTLGADNGIAVAMMLTLMRGYSQYRHGPVDLLFTIDEETGLTGAMNLAPEMLGHRRLLNLDGEEEGIFYIGCAGGKETTGSLPLNFQQIPPGHESSCLVLDGLAGGHSGADIHKQPANALKLLARFLWMQQEELELSLIDFHGGEKHNAICREAFCTVAFPEQKKTAIAAAVSTWETLFRAESAADEPGLRFRTNPTDPSKPNEAPPTQALSPSCQNAFVRLTYCLPHGVLTMSRTMPGLVSSSSNLAAIRFGPHQAEFTTSQRSDLQTLMDDAANVQKAHFELAGGQGKFSREYPSWTPQPSSPLLAQVLDQYRKFTPEHSPVVASIHAGLECGVIGSRQPGMDMVSFGPDILGAHTPQERVNIASTARVWRFLLAFLGES